MSISLCFAKLTVPHFDTIGRYFCRRKKQEYAVRKKKNSIFALHYEDSVSYGVTVGRNRQVLATEHTDRYVRIGVLFSVIQLLRGVWRCPFYLKSEGVRYFLFQNGGSDVM